MEDEADICRKRIALQNRLGVKINRKILILGVAAPVAFAKASFENQVFFVTL
jgi:hypothetical protein